MNNIININDLQRGVNLGLINEEEAKKMFEDKFGKDQKSRTAKQWRNLVKAYGAKTVMEKEGVDAKELIKRCQEKWSDEFKRLSKLKNAGNNL